jgi:iron(III) transport system ATP-binding protein
VPRPQVMLLDEPFSGLDQRLRETVRTETLALLHETRATCIFVTHDPTEALEISDRILLMRAGSIVQIAAPKELYDNPIDAAAARFFGDYNEISGVVRNGAINTAVGHFTADNQKDGSHVVVMIRPHAIRQVQGRAGIEAFVSERRFLGDLARITLNVAGLDQTLSAHVSGTEKIERGQSLRFVVDPSGILVFTKG